MSTATITIDQGARLDDSLELDPMTQVYNAQWDLLENNEAFKKLVPAGNRVKFSGTNTRNPVKDEVKSADFPEVRITPISGVYQLFATSSHVKFIKRFQVQAASGDMRVDQYLYPLEIAIIAALSHWPETMQQLTWKEHRFFTKLELGDAPEGIRQSDLQRDIKGWSTLLTTSALFYIITADLLGVL